MHILAAVRVRVGVSMAIASIRIGRVRLGLVTIDLVVSMGRPMSWVGGVIPSRVIRVMTSGRLV